MGGYKRVHRYPRTTPSRTGRNPAVIQNRSVPVSKICLSIVSFQRAAHPFPATVVAMIDQNIDAPITAADDPQLTEVLRFRDEAIQHTIEDAMKFFNETYGVDFSTLIRMSTSTRMQD